MVAAANPSAESTVVDAVALVFFSTYGASDPDPAQTVKWTRNGVLFPEES